VSVKRKLSGNAVCPCGSKKKYKDCCTSKKFEWLIDNQGTIYRSVPICPESMPILKQYEKRFVKTFGRKPRGDDPLMFEGISSKEMDQKMIDVMVKAGIDPAKIYAFAKTGLLPTEQNLSLIPDIDLREWEAAIDEYEEGKQFPTYDRDTAKFIASLAELPDQLDLAQLFMNRIVSEHGVARNVSAATKDRVHAFHDFTLFCATKSLKSLRAIKHLLEEGHGEDALMLIRSLYENYLNLVYVLSQPTQINNVVAVKLGLRVGKYEFDRRSGKIRTKVGEKIVGEHVSVRRMAKESPFPEDLAVYRFLYEFLSDFAHPNILTIAYYLDDDRFDVVGADNVPHAAIYSLFTITLILDLMSLFKELKGGFRKDIQRFVRRTKKRLTDVFSRMIDANESSETARVFVNRLRKGADVVLAAKPSGT